jgi:predicted methyltransferase
LATLILTACGSASKDEPVGATDKSDAPSTASAPRLASLLASESRDAADRARDAGRRPAEVIEFLGIESGMNVIDVIAGGGYYTEVLSYAVGKNGRVSAQNPAIVLQMRDGANDKEMSKRLANDRLANVSRLDRELDELLPEDGPFDAALTALNLHDIYNNYDEEGAIGALKTISAALKPGAVFGLIDHHGAAGNDNKELHRINVDDAIRVAEAAGFIVEARSGLLHVHNDDLTENVFGEGRRGNTHRFLLRLRKPE